MSGSPGQTRPNKVVKSNSIPKKNPVGTGTLPPTSLVKHQSFIGSPKSIRKLGQQEKDLLARRDSKLPEGESDTREHALIRYMDPDLFRRITGQTNLKLITRLDLSCPTNNPNSRKFPYVDHMDGLTNLVELNLSGNVLSRCDRLGKLSQLQKLYISYNKLETLEGLWPLFNLTILDVSYNQILRVPNNLPKKLTALRELYLAGNKLSSLPDIIKLRSLTGLVHMSVADNPVERLPHCRGMIVYGIPTLEILDGDPITQEEKGEAGVKYARETLELHETELLMLREKVTGLEQDVEEAMKGREQLEKSDTQSRQELRVRTQENERLDHELGAQKRLVDQKTSELNKALEGRYQLENELAFYKLDYKVDSSRYTDMFQPNFAPDSESSDMEEIPYVGQARFKPNEMVHRINLRDMSQPAPYQLMPGAQHSREGTVHMNPSDPAVIARQVYKKEQEIQASNSTLDDLRVKLTRSDQNIQTCEESQGGSPLSEEESERLRNKLSAVREELRELRRKQQDQLDLSQILGASDEETASLIRDSEVFENASDHELSHIAELISEKEIVMREMDKRVSGSASVGEQVELMRLESSTLTDQLKAGRGEQDRLVADKAQLVTHLNDVLNIQGVSVPVETIDNSEEMEILRERARVQDQEIEGLAGELERMRAEMDALLRRVHKETAEAGVSARCHMINQSTNTPRPRPKLDMSTGSSVNIPSGDQAWERERQDLLGRIKQLEDDLGEKNLVNQVLQDSIDRTELERNRAIAECNQSEEERLRCRNELLDAQTEIDELKRTLAQASEALERMDDLDRERRALEGRLCEEEQERHQVEGENKRLRDKATQLKQLLTQSEEARRGVNNRVDALEDELRNKETDLVTYHQEIVALRDYISQMERDRNRPVLTQSTQTHAGPNFQNMLQQLQNLINVVPEQGEPEAVATDIQNLPPPSRPKYQEEGLVGELSDRLVGLLDRIGGELAQVREQLVEAEAENADLKEIMNPLLCHRTTQTGPDPQLVQLGEELEDRSRHLDTVEHELAALKNYRGVDVSTQVRPRLTNQISQANIIDNEMLRENEELARQVNNLEREKEGLMEDLDQMDLGIKARDDQIQNLEEDVEQLLTENERLKRDLHNTVGVQTSNGGREEDLMVRQRDRCVSPRAPYDFNELSAIGDDVARLQGIVDKLESTDPRERGSPQTESIDLNDLDQRPPHRNVSLQANLFDTASKGMQTGGPSHYTQTFPFSESLGTQTHNQSEYNQIRSAFDSPQSVDENSVFSNQMRPPNRTEIRIPDDESIHVKSKSTVTRKPGGTGKRREVRDIFIDEEIISSETEEEEERPPPLPTTEKTTRIHYRTTRGAQTEKPKTPKKAVTHSDTELHDKIYISKKKRKHRVHNKKRARQVPKQPSTGKTFVVISESDSDTDSVHSVVEPGDDYIYVHGKHKKNRRRGTLPANGGTDYRIHVSKSSRRPDIRTKHYYTTDEHDYFCNVPEHADMEEEIDRLEALLGVSNRRNRDRSTHVDVTVRHSLLDRLTDIERLLKDKVDKLGAKQEEQERLNHQLSREQQHLSRTAAELSRAGNELQQINVQLRGRSRRTDDITGQTSHGGMTPQLDTLQRRVEGLTGILQEAETRGNEEVAELMAKKARIQREIIQQQNELDHAKCSLQEINDQKRCAQNEYYRCVEEKAELEDSIKNLTLTRVKEEGRLKHLKKLVQDLRSLQTVPDQSGIAALEAKRHSLESQIRHLQQDVNNISSQEETADSLRYSQNECNVLRDRVRRYKERIRELELELRRTEALEHQNEVYMQEISELRAELEHVHGKQDNLHRHYNTKHTHTIDRLLHDLQSQLSNLQDNISTELYRDDLNPVSNNLPPLQEPLPQENSEVLPDIGTMRVKSHQAILNQINREHETLMQYLQGNMQEGEKTVLSAQQETMQGVFDLKRQIEQLQTVLNQHKEPPTDIPYQVELGIRQQNELLYQVDRKIDKMSGRWSKPKLPVSPIPRVNPLLNSSQSNPISSRFDTCTLPYTSSTLEAPSRDIPHYQFDPPYSAQPHDLSASTTLRKSYDSAFDRNSPPSPLAPADSILFEDQSPDSPPPERRNPRSSERRQDHRGSPYTLPRTARDMSGSLDYNHSMRSPSSHSTASLLRMQIPDEHKLKLLDHRHAQDILTRPNH